MSNPIASNGSSKVTFVTHTLPPDNKDECTICQDLFIGKDEDTGKTLKVVAHKTDEVVKGCIFHLSCLIEWIETKKKPEDKKCPLCKQQIAQIEGYNKLLKKRSKSCEPASHNPARALRRTINRPSRRTIDRLRHRVDAAGRATRSHHSRFNASTRVATVDPRWAWH